MRCCYQVATALFVAFALYPSAARAQVEAEDSRPVIAVLDFTNSSLIDHAEWDPFRAGIAGMLISDLAQNSEIVVVERERLREVLDELELGSSGRVDADAAARAGRILNAQHVILGVFVIDPRESLRIDARAVNVETTAVEHVETATGDVDGLLEVVGTLGGMLSTGLDLPAPSGSRPQPERDAQAGQVRLNLMYSRALLREDQGDFDGALDLYRTFLHELPDGYALALRGAVEERVRELSAR